MLDSLMRNGSRVQRVSVEAGNLDLVGILEGSSGALGELVSLCDAC